VIYSNNSEHYHIQALSHWPRGFICYFRST